MKYMLLAMLITGCGPQGAKGPQGGPGTDGIPGPSPTPCSVVSVAASGTPGALDQYGGVEVTCPNGSSFISNGVPGAGGPAGLNATPITAVQLCPGTTTYPGMFVEIALCIDNVLYAVYSTPSAFLTEIPPGEYTSQGIGASCNLTVEPNCVVVH